jgi:hypothetical protein
MRRGGNRASIRARIWAMSPSGPACRPAERKSIESRICVARSVSARRVSTSSSSGPLKSYSGLRAALHHRLFQPHVRTEPLGQFERQPAAYRRDFRDRRSMIHQHHAPRLDGRAPCSGNVEIVGQDLDQSRFARRQWTEFGRDLEPEGTEFGRRPRRRVPERTGSVPGWDRRRAAGDADRAYACARPDVCSVGARISAGRPSSRSAGTRSACSSETGRTGSPTLLGEPLGDPAQVQRRIRTARTIVDQQDRAHGCGDLARRIGGWFGARPGAWCPG